MKVVLQILTGLLFSLVAVNRNYAQNCIDSSLIDPSAICPTVFDPVCGCDGNTYENACVATTTGGVTSYTAGGCTSNDTCLYLPMGVDFGFCAMPLGWASYGGECQMISGCSVIGSDGIDYSAYFFTNSYACNAMCLTDTTITIGCIDTTLIDLTVQIPAIYEPVCGCDSVTYQNVSEAIYHHGIVSYTQGACQTANSLEKDQEIIHVYPNPFDKELIIQNSTLQLKNIHLFTVDGQLKQTIPIEGKTYSLDARSLVSGVYIIVFEGEAGAILARKKVVK